MYTITVEKNSTATDCHDHVHVCAVVPKTLAHERLSMVISSSIYKRLLLLYCDIKDVTFLFRAFLLLGPTKNSDGRPLPSLHDSQSCSDGEWSPGQVQPPFLLGYSIHLIRGCSIWSAACGEERKNWLQAEIGTYKPAQSGSLATVVCLSEQRYPTFLNSKLLSDTLFDSWASSFLLHNWWNGEKYVVK
jgi:hypothetical protein